MLELAHVSHVTWACMDKGFRCGPSPTVFIKCILFNTQKLPGLLLKLNFRKSSPISTSCQWLFHGFFRNYPCPTFLLSFYSLPESQVFARTVFSKIFEIASAVFTMIVQPASQSHGNSSQRCCFSLVWNKFLHRWTIQCLRITLSTINRDKEIQLYCSHGIPLSLDTSVKMHTSEPELSFCLTVSLRTGESFCQNDIISWHLQNVYSYRCFMKGSWSEWPIQTKSI